MLDSVGGLAYLSRLARDTPTAASVRHYVDIVRDRAMLRRLHALAGEIGQTALEGRERGAADILADAQTRLLTLQARSRSGTGLVQSQDLARDLIDDLDTAHERQGLALGLADFDGLSGGLEPGDLVVIAARPGMGKTAWLVTVAGHVSRAHTVAVFSAEMPARQLMRRTVALLGGIPQRHLRRTHERSEADWERISAGTSAAAERRLWIDDTALPTLTHIRAECAATKARNGLDLVMVDYVQLVQGRGANRYEELRQVAYGLKAIAKDLAVPVIVLAQLNRGVESRPDKRPYISDLRDSGAIEEAADIIGLLYAEGYYDPQHEMRDVLECAIEKHRNGERGECLWRFAGEYSQITVLDDCARRQYRQLRARQQQRRGASHDL